MSINCEIFDLRAFQAVVDLESFHRAAEALHISQPALTRRIQKLEQSIGAPLLDRHWIPHGFRPIEQPLYLFSDSAEVRHPGFSGLR